MKTCRGKLRLVYEKIRKNERNGRVREARRREKITRRKFDVTVREWPFEILQRPILRQWIKFQFTTCIDMSFTRTVFSLNPVSLFYSLSEYYESLYIIYAVNNNFVNTM